MLVITYILLEGDFMKGNTTREKILIASKEVFSNKGYMRATTKEISKLASVAEITLFRHFNTKINLFYETIMTYLVLPMSDLKIVDSTEDAEQAMIALTQERIDTLKNNRELFLCIIYEAQFNTEIKEMLQSIHTKVFDILKLHLELKSKEADAVEIENAIQLFLSIIIGTIIFETVSDNGKNIASRDLMKVFEKLNLE